MSRNKQLFSFKNKFCISAHDQSGIALPLVLMVLIVLTILGTAGWTASQSSLKQASALRPHLQAEYLARSAVDATKEAWTARWLANPAEIDEDESVTFYTSYDHNTDEFKEETAANKDQDGVITTVQEYNADAGVCTITSSVKVGRRSATVKARSEKVTNTNVSNSSGEPWYDLQEYEHWLVGSWWTWHDWSILPGPDEETITDDDGKTYDATYHHTEGIVVIRTDDSNSTLYANISPDEFNITGLQAKRIEFECPLNLYFNTSNSEVLNTPNPHSLVLSAETIVFKQRLVIGDSSFGNLSLALPPGAGLPGNIVYKQVAEANTKRNTGKVDLDLIDLDARYGVVKFSAVDIRGSLIGHGQDNDYRLIENKAFFFRAMDDKALNIGTEPNTFSRIADFFNITDTENDCRFKTLLDKGYLIPATSDDVESYYDILFFYE
jgi:Tfp pilus assembly protein PilX